MTDTTTRWPPLMPLSRREQDVLVLLAEHLTYWEIAGELRCGMSTVKNDVRAIIWKMGADDRKEAVVIARQEGLLDPRPLPPTGAERWDNPAIPRGWQQLTEREREVALLLTDHKNAGLTAEGLALVAHCKPATMKTHLKRIYAKLNVSTRASAALLATAALRQGGTT